MAALPRKVDHHKKKSCIDGPKRWELVCWVPLVPTKIRFYMILLHGFSINGGTSKCMAYFIENTIRNT